GRIAVPQAGTRAHDDGQSFDTVVASVDSGEEVRAAEGKVATRGDDRAHGSARARDAGPLEAVSQRLRVCDDATQDGRRVATHRAADHECASGDPCAREHLEITV